MGKRVVAFDEIVRGEKLVRYAAQHAEACGVEVQTLQLWKSVAQFFREPLTRVKGLDWEHHRIAKWGSGGDLAVAQELLALALEKGWKASRLKAHINQTKRADEAEADGPEAQSLLPIELTNCRRWASAAIHQVADIPEKDAWAHWAELEQVRAYITALGRRLYPTLSALPATPGGKESLSA